MPLENRDLRAGTILTARYKKQDRTCEVVQTDDGLRYRLDDGTEHRSPSSAGKAAMGGVACNGWRFWSLQGELKPVREPKAKAERKPKSEKPATKKAPAKKKASKKTAKKPARAASSDSYGCGACGETFSTQKKAVAHALTHTS